MFLRLRTLGFTPVTLLSRFPPIGRVALAIPVAPLALALSALPDRARAAASEDVTYDFLSKSLTVRGYHVPKEGEKKSGLAAELDARTNGVATLGGHISKTCEGGTGSKLLASDWQRSLRSQGSEIFANGVLRIILTASLKDVFKGYGSSKAKALKTPEGQPIVFRLPSLPQGTISCGMVRIEFDGKRYEAAPVALGEPGEGAKVVNLLLGSGGLLKVSSPEDVSLLEKAKFPAEVTLEGEGIVIPVSQGG